MDKLAFDAFAARYCERQVQTPEGLREVLSRQAEEFQPDGWFLAECVMLDSSYRGSLVIFPYGPRNTFKEVPDASRPFSPRGLASDQSVAVAYLVRGDLPEGKK